MIRYAFQKYILYKRESKKLKYTLCKKKKMLDFADGIARSRVLEPFILKHDDFILIKDRGY